MNKFSTYIIIVLLFAALVAVRGYVQPFFYDPLIDFFKMDYLYNYLPELNFPKYFFHIFLRYLLNSTISIGIIYLIFKDLKKVKFAASFYAIAFSILSIFLFIQLKYNVFDSYLLIFYTRRFLIQPLFLFILLAAFYYQKLQLKQ